MAEKHSGPSVAIVGAGASGTITAAAFAAENHFHRIRVFERRETAGGTWIYDPDPSPLLPIHPGSLPPTSDPPLAIPSSLPRATSPDRQERYLKTPVYDNLTTNVPEIAMSFSDARFAYGPFVPHHVPRQYLENYVSTHQLDALLVTNTTVEDISRRPPAAGTAGGHRWTLTLRRYDVARRVDLWWEEDFDFVVLANGHYSVPFIPQVKGLEAYLQRFPNRIIHSKSYRSPSSFANKRILVIGNSASGHDISVDLLPHVSLPLLQSRRSKGRNDGAEAPPGVLWKPVISEYLPSGRILFTDSSYLDVDDVDVIIYCTGYLPSYPFWNPANGPPLFSYEENKLVGNYLHTFFHSYPTLGIVGIPKVLTFRSFEYQAVALARVFAGREKKKLPDRRGMQNWERQRSELVRREKRKFHDIVWDADSEGGETADWLNELFEIAGLGTLYGDGRIPPYLSKELIYAVNNIRKYPIPDDEGKGSATVSGDDHSWVMVGNEADKDVLYFL